MIVTLLLLQHACVTHNQSLTPKHIASPIRLSRESHVHNPHRKVLHHQWTKVHVVCSMLLRKLRCTQCVATYPYGVNVASYCVSAHL
eukprot:m.125873 g.125873  ORF g.125873 m.125873 type:complete len:87 (+) comp13813_c1_seq2:697-957(+)